MSIKNIPTVSVVMSVYNAEKYIDESIHSILSQTYRDFEFIIIDDGSTDNSLAIIEKYKKQDSRIKVISRENRGLIASLNEGIKKASGQYIARMDADDVSLPERFEKQIKWMLDNNLDICGCSIYTIDSFNNYISAKVFSSSIALNRIILTKKVPFAHGSVMIKRAFLISHNLFYGNTIYNKAEDYALWIQIQEKNGKISNVNEFLFKYRDVEQSLSKNNLNHKHAKKLSSEYIRKNYLELNHVFNKYQDKIGDMNLFEKELMSYFLIKTLFKGRILQKLKAIKKISPSINIINLMKVLFG